MFKLHTLTKKDWIRRGHLDGELQPSVRNWKTCQQRQSIMSWTGSQSTLTARQTWCQRPHMELFQWRRERQTPNRKSKPLCKCRIPNPVLSHSTRQWLNLRLLNRPKCARSPSMFHPTYCHPTAAFTWWDRRVKRWTDGQKRQIFVTKMMRQLS